MKTVTLYYRGDDYDRAVEVELSRLGLRHGEVRVLALPESMRTKKAQQQEFDFEN